MARFSPTCLRLVQILFIAFLYEVVNATSSCERHLKTQTLCTSVHGSDTGEVQPVSLIYTRAAGHHDAIHYLYSTLGIPSVLVVKTNLSAQLNVSCDRFLNSSVQPTENSISFNETTLSVFVLMIPEIIDYIDLKDTADMEAVNSTLVTVHHLSNATWAPAMFTEYPDYSEVLFRLAPESVSPSVHSNGSLQISMKAFCSAGYHSERPNLQYSSNVSLVDVTLDNVVTVSNESRLAVTLLLLTDRSMDGNMSMEVTRSIDDEHSPGSFKLINWLSDINQTDLDSFLQWKPASYLSAQRSIQSLSSSKYYGLRPFPFNGLQRGLAVDYFGDPVLSNRSVDVVSNRVSFGLPGDDFYKKTKFIAWSFSFGFGEPPSDHISLMIIMIIVVGLGIPVVLIIAGMAYMCLRKYRRRDGYEEITSSYSEIN